ncbi:MAG: sialidase, partial [Gemmatimonadales bacterium]
SIWASFDDGRFRQPLQTNLPAAPVSDITVQEQFNDLVLATYGRGFWILDDVTALQQFTPEIKAKPAHLFPPRPAWRFRFVEPPMTAVYDPVVGQNPASGALLTFWLAAEPADSVTLTVSDAAGAVVRSLKVKGRAGLNRTNWDLRSDDSRKITMRTAPLYAPEFTTAAAGRPSPSINPVALLAAPGRYTVTLTAAGTSMSQPLEVRKDPNTTGTERTIAEQTALATELRGQLDGVADMVNSLEGIRAQLATLGSVIKDPAVKAAADSLDRRVIEVEEQLTQLRITGRGQDLIRYPAKIGEQLAYLINDVGSTDNAPTGPQREVGASLTQRARDARNDFDRLVNRDVAAFNRTLQEKGLGGIVTQSGRPTP